jgi:hypothetical protein
LPLLLHHLLHLIHPLLHGLHLHLLFLDNELLRHNINVGRIGAGPITVANLPPFP